MSTLFCEIFILLFVKSNTKTFNTRRWGILLKKMNFFEKIKPLYDTLKTSTVFSAYTHSLTINEQLAPLFQFPIAIFKVSLAINNVLCTFNNLCDRI